MSNPAYPYNTGYPPAPQGPQPQHPYGQPAPYPQQAPQGYAPAPAYQPQQQQPAWMPTQQQYNAPPPPPAATGTLNDFLGQPRTGGGNSISWKGKQPGYTVTGTIARDVIDSDIRQQTDTVSKRPQFFNDGRPKWVMVVPLIVPPSQEHPDGRAQWYVKGDAHNALAEAMSKSGSTAKVPEGGAVVSVTLTGQRPSGQGMSPANTFAVQYTPPGQAPQAPASAAEPQGYPQGYPPAHQQDVPQSWQPPVAGSATQYQPQTQWQPSAPQYAQGGPIPPAAQPPYVPDNGYVVPNPTQPAPQAAPPAPAATGPAPSASTPPATASSSPQVPSQAGPAPTPEQQALIAQLTAGGQAPAPQQG